MIAAYTRNITLLDAQDIVKRVVNSSLPNTSSLKKFPDLDKSETWLDGNRSISFRNFNILRSDGPFSKSGGLLIAIKEHIPFS
ncbi:abc transporter permease atp-binding protein [Lasius niger]|uniref:Abc transporter permease atp-binding protein n=1 Tax=Lasius niger TaxID=67767 RepID=A0A0J7NJ52_LASNI|nr:abc transporter permease atp-binding protein [Lasius niger]